MPAAVSPSPATDRFHHQRFKLLGVLGLAQLVLVLDAFIVTIALPTMQADLGLTDVGRVWVVAGYSLAVAGLLPFGGRLTDALGPRRALLVGVAGFGIASALAGAATSGGMEITARLRQGAFAAILAPASSAMLVATFAPGRERSNAFGVFGMVGAVGAALGMVLGGLLTEFVSWRGTMYVNLIFAAAIAAGLLMWAAPGRVDRRVRLDIPSTLTVTAGLLALVYGISSAGRGGWLDPWTFALLTGGLLAIGGFLVGQRAARNPLLPMTVFADRDRIGAQIAQFVIGFGVIGEYLFLNYYLQEVQHYSALAAGLAYLPFIAVQVLTTSLVLKRAAGRVGSRFLMPVGLVAGAAGTAALGFIRPDTPYTACVLPAMVLIGIGWGMFFSVASEVVVRGAEQSQVGIAAAVGSSLNSIGGSIGTALLGTIASAVSAGSAAPADLARGYLATFWVCAAVLVVGAALIAPILRPGPLHTDRK